MSRDFPVGASVTEAADFARHRWGAIIRFGWAPAVISLFILGIFVAGVIDIEAVQSAAAEDRALAPFDALRLPFWQFALAGLVVYALAFFFWAGALTSVLRLVALGEDRPGAFHLRMDGAAARVYLACLFTAGVSIAVSLAIMAAVGFAMGVDPVAAFEEIMRVAAETERRGSASPEATGRLADAAGFLVLGGLAAAIPSIYLAVKFAPFATAAACEDRLDFRAAFAMTTGAFWRVLGALVLMTAFLLLAALIFQLAAGVLDLVAGMMRNRGGAGAAIGVALGIVLALASVIFNAFVYSAQFALNAIIYRRLKTGQ